MDMVQKLNVVIDNHIQMTRAIQEVRLPKGRDIALGAVLAEVLNESPVVVLLGNLESKIEEGLQGVPCVVPFASPLNLLLPLVVRAYQEALLQMAVRNVLGKDVASLIATLMHVGIVLLLLIAHLVVTAMVE